MAILLGLTAGSLRADVKVLPIFGDHMVLQQDAPLPVWGTAEAGEKVTVTVGADTASTEVGADGKWRVNLSPLASTATPLTMTIAGKNTLTFTDVLVGEVWFASGQSNMAFPFERTKDVATDAPKADDPLYRFYKVNGSAGIGMEPSDQLSAGAWEASSPTTALQMSGVAYYFGKHLRETLKRPVAIVQSAVGGTVAEAWTPLDALKKDPALQSYVDAYNAKMATYPALAADFPAKNTAWRKEYDEWNKEVGAAFAPVNKAWVAELDKARAAGETPPPAPKPSRPAPKPPEPPYGGNATPTVLYNGLVAPVMPFAIRGVIWYQGESNSGSWEKYHAAFSALITGWREHWGEGDFPFLFVQLPKYGPANNWPPLREAQAQTLALPNTAMATVIDVGDANNLHPPDKADVGERLSLVARHLVYGEKKLVWTGPIYDSMKVEGDSIRIKFTQTGSGLKIGSSPWVPPRSTAIPTTSLVGFVVADDSKHWVPADAKIDGDSVVVSSSQVPKPVAVRYAWGAAPDANLYNNEDLTAAPFRTDDWSDVVAAPTNPASATAPSTNAPPVAK